MSNGNVDVTVTKEGLVIPMNLLKDSHIGDNVGIVKKEDLIIIKEKSGAITPVSHKKPGASDSTGKSRYKTDGRYNYDNNPFRIRMIEYGI